MERIVCNEPFDAWANLLFRPLGKDPYIEHFRWFRRPARVHLEFRPPRWPAPANVILQLLTPLTFPPWDGNEGHALVGFWLAQHGGEAFFMIAANGGEPRFEYSIANGAIVNLVPNA